MPAPRHTGTLSLTNIGRECEFIAAGTDPLFGSYEADDYTAYSRIKFCKCLPMVAGPESRSGMIFGLHPAVIARCYEGIIHKQMNMGHQLVALGSKEDRICGCVLAAAFPAEPDGGWVIPATIDDAPSITAMAALFKQAKGVDSMVGKHLTGKVKMAVSIEFTYYNDEIGVYDPVTNKAYDRADIPNELWTFLAEDQKGKLIVRKSTRAQPPVILPGGVSGRIWFSGVGYTDRPAEKTAEVESITASRKGEMMVCETLELPTLAPGMTVKWSGGEFNRGEVRAVHMDGVHQRHNKRLAATAADPVLDILLPNGVAILRTAKSVTKKS